MILKLCMDKQDQWGKRINYYYKDVITSSLFATVTYNINEWATLYYNGNKYEFCNHPKIIFKSQINIDYPLSSKRKKTIGFRIIENDDCIAAKYYGEAATVKKLGFLKRNIVLTVYEYQQEPYIQYRVGYWEEKSHYYCLYNNYGETVVITERHPLHHDDGSKARIYIKDDEYILIALFACTNTIVDTGYRMVGDPDRSAGNYVSIDKEEKAMLDRSFIERVKQMAKEEAQRKGLVYE